MVLRTLTLTVLLASCSAPPVLMSTESTTRGANRKVKLAKTVHRAAVSNKLSEAAANQFIRDNIAVGDADLDAMNLLVRAGFACRQLRPEEYSQSSPDQVKAISCHVAADRKADGYRVVYGNLSANEQGRLLLVTTGSYPVVYRNVRVDETGRLIVVPDVPRPSGLPSRSVISTGQLRGRWTIAEVNSRPVSGLWLELGGEGLATINKVGNSVYVNSPQPQTRAYLGCNWWDLSGWSRAGDMLILGIEASRRTERGCDSAKEALDDEAYALLAKKMSIEFTSPDRLRLVNDNGTMQLIRAAPVAK